MRPHESPKASLKAEIPGGTSFGVDAYDEMHCEQSVEPTCEGASLTLRVSHGQVLTRRLGRPRVQLPPQPFKPRRISRCVLHGMLNVSVSQIVLYQARVRALIGKGVTASVSQHVWVRRDGKVCGPSIVPNKHPRRLAAQGLTAFTDKQRLRVRVHARALSEPHTKRAQFIIP